MLVRSTFVVAVVVAACVPLAAEERQPDPKDADKVLEDSPITLVFGKFRPLQLPGDPTEWAYSINSAGAAEPTIRYVGEPKKPTRQKFEIPADKLAAVRQALRDERFFNLQSVDGPVAFDSGWTTLMVSAGPLTATQHLHSPNWAGWKPEEKKAAALAMRTFLAVRDAVDPEGKVFTELPKIKEIVRELEIGSGRRKPVGGFCG